MANIGKAIKYARGSIWNVNMIFEQEAKGLQNANRPCVIISSDDGNNTNDTVIVALITSRDKANREVNVPFININNAENVVLCNQIFTVSKEWLSYRPYGMLPESVMIQVENAITLALGINTNIPNINDLFELINNYIEVRTKEIESKNNIVTNSLVDATINKINSEVSKLEEKQKGKQNKESLSEVHRKRGRKSKEELDKQKELLNTACGTRKTDSKKDEALTEEQLLAKKLADALNKSSIKLPEGSENLFDTNSVLNKEIEASEKVDSKPTKKRGRPKKTEVTDKQVKEESKGSLLKTKKVKTSSRKPLGFWTDDKKQEFVNDRATMSIDEIKSKWGMDNTKSIYQMYYKFKVDLGLQ